MPRPHIAVIHGPNLNLLGMREPEFYGTTSLAELDAHLITLGATLGLEVTTFQSNHEGVLVDHIHALRGRTQGIVMNAGGLSHTSIVLRDALVATSIPCVEVHLSNTFGRETFRHTSYLAAIARGVIVGFGPASYELGLRSFLTA